MKGKTLRQVNLKESYSESWSEGFYWCLVSSETNNFM